MNSFQPQLWIERASEAVSFYERGFGAEVLHKVGDGDDIVAHLAVGDAVFWVSQADSAAMRFSPDRVGGTTGRVLLVTATPEALVALAVEAGAVETSPVRDEHGWRLGRVVDPLGHHWEVGRPLGDWPPS